MVNPAKIHCPYNFLCAELNLSAFPDLKMKTDADISSYLVNYTIFVLGLKTLYVFMLFIKAVQRTVVGFKEQGAIIWNSYQCRQYITYVGCLVACIAFFFLDFFPFK